MKYALIYDDIINKKWMLFGTFTNQAELLKQCNYVFKNARKEATYNFYVIVDTETMLEKIPMRDYMGFND